MSATPILYAAATMLLQVPSQAQTGRPGHIVLDGRFEDWTAIAPVTADVLGDSAAEIDWGEVRVAADDRFVLLLVDIGNLVNIQRLEGNGMLVLDCDGDPATGKEDYGLAGVDVMIQFSPHRAEARPREIGSGIALISTTYRADDGDESRAKLTPYDVGFTFAPTYASRVVEMRLQRGATVPQTPPLLAGSRFSGKLVYLDSAGAVRDETESFTIALPAMPAAGSDPGGADNLPGRPAGTALRILTWNIERGSLLEKPDPFIRIIKAVDPDVLLLQELRDDQSGREIQALLDKKLPASSGSWQVAFGEGGGDLRTAIASRTPLAPQPTLQNLAMPDSQDRGVRTAGATAEIGGRRILLVSAHLKCCGQTGSREDVTRQAEAQAIRGAILDATAARTADGIIVTGDLNLVGSLRPLLMLSGVIDHRQPVLGVLDPLRPRGDANSTWADRGQPFVPGRLDFVLYSKTVLRPLGSFVVDTVELAPACLQKYGLKADDSVTASDHRPVIADFAWEAK